MITTSMAAALLLATTPTAAPATALADAAIDAVAEAATEQEQEQAKPTIDTPIEQLMANEGAKAVVAQNMGGTDLTEHPMYGQFQSMSLKELQPWSGGQITPEMIEQIAADLEQL